MKTIRKAALALQNQRKPIFPVNRKTKKPLVKWKPYQNRLPTKNEVNEWFSTWPDANIAMATGSLSGVLIVDCDSKVAVDNFTQSYPEALDTLQVKTGRGRHFYFRFEKGIKNDCGKILGPKIDIRAEGGFVILPPSVHPNGKPYRS